MAQASRYMSPLLAFLAGLAIASPVCADGEMELVMQELDRLKLRMAQLEEDNKRLKQELNERNSGAREKEIVRRLEDMEKEAMSRDRWMRPLKSLQGVSAEASLLMVGQGTVKGAVNGKDESRINYRADVEVGLPAGSFGEAEGELFAHFRVGQGSGLGNLPPTLTGTPNSSTFELIDGDDSAAMLAQVWYGMDIPIGESRLEVNVGKIDPFVFFDQNDIADDESAAFLNNVFVHNPLLDSGGDMEVDAYGFAPGLRLAWRNDGQSPDYWQASMGVFSVGGETSFDTDFARPFVIGQLEAGGRYAFDMPGVYRLYAWNKGGAIPFGNEFEAGSERHSGWGVSANQQVAEHVSVFGRYGHSTAGKMRFDRAVTLGAEIGGAWWGRENDRIGVAAGWLNTSKAFRSAAPALDADADGTADFGYAPNGAESQFEIYYAWQLNEHLALSPDLQWIRHPGGDERKDDIAIVGLRAKASF